jgi:hypothetical protein
MDEEVVLLEEQLATATADIERLQALLADAEARAATREADAAELKRQLDAAYRELEDREVVGRAHAAEIEALRGELNDADGRLRSAAGRYRDIILTHEPELPAELVGGETFEAVDESVTRARQTVAQVRQHLDQQALALRVPAGAPIRSAPDMSGLSSAEKIRLGLQQVS